MSQDSPSIAIEWKTSAEEIPTALWAACFPPPAEGLWWCKALERGRMEDQFRFRYALIEQAGEPIGIAPCVLFDFPLDVVLPSLLANLVRGAGRIARPLRYRRTLFLGALCAEEGGIGLLPGFDLEEIAPALQDALEGLARHEKAGLIVWRDLPDKLFSRLSVLESARGLHPVVSYPGMAIPVTFADYESYLMSISKSRRNNLRNKVKRSLAMGPLDAEALKRPSPAMLDEILALYEGAYRRGAIKLERLTRAFFEAIADQPQGYFLVLRDPARNGRIVAFSLTLLSGTRCIHKYLGLDPEYGGDWFLYFRLWKFAVEWAIEMKSLEISTGPTSYSAKFRTGQQPIPLNNYFKHRNPIVHRMLVALAGTITLATLDDDLKMHLSPLKE